MQRLYSPGLLVLFLFVFATPHLLTTTAMAGEVKAVTQFDLNRYLGTWHEIARFPARFQRGCSNAKAVYAKVDTKKISVVNTCTRNGKTASADGDAIVKGAGKLGVKFSVLQPFRAPYWVLWIDKGYQTVAVGEPGKKFGWILSRSATRSRASVAEAIKAFEQNGYDTTKLIWN
jgi:apolipoprotein D and lipocalin family protein